MEKYSMDSDSPDLKILLDNPGKTFLDISPMKVTQNTGEMFSIKIIITIKAFQYNKCKKLQ